MSENKEIYSHEIYHHLNDLFHDDPALFTLRSFVADPDVSAGTFSDYLQEQAIDRRAPATSTKAFDDSDLYSWDEGIAVKEILQVDADLCSDGGAATGAGGGGGCGSGRGTPATPNSSICSSSTEATAEAESGKTEKDHHHQQQNEQAKACEDQSDGSKKVCKSKKKGGKRQREQRFAFVTKTEVEHLEDGYRWRKYGQKAVKNSPYPRSYYRCTTLKCSVLKRVERSYQDPSVVITTYEGRHNHPSPATLRGSTHVLAPPPPPMPAGYHVGNLLAHSQHLLYQQYIFQGDHTTNPNMFLQNLQSSPLQQFQVPADYNGLLQDIIPHPSISSTQPWHP